MSTVVSLTCIFTGLWGITRILESKKKYFLFRVLCVIGLTFGQSCVSLLQIPILNTISFLLLVVLATLICVKCKTALVFVYDLLIVIISFVSDIIGTLCLSTISQHTISNIMQQANYVFATHILTCVFSFILCNITFSLLKKKQASTKWYETIFYGMLGIGEAATTDYIASHVQQSSTGTFLIFFLIGCFILDVYIVFVFYRLAIVRDTEKENALLRQQADMQMTVYKDLQSRYDYSMKIVHDAKKHVAALEGLIQSDHMQEAERFRTELYQQLNKMYPTFHHENQLLAVIVNHALQKAEKKNIQLKLQIENTDLSFISDMDLTTIVSNILDNALEAVDELPKENRKVLFIIEEKMGCILFHSENAYAKLNKTASKKYVSTKEGHMGVGLVNIESSVKQYDGIFTIDVQNKKFIVLITIPRK
jgi:hypothetical protein